MKLRDLMNPNIIVFDESVSLEHVLEKIRYSRISYVISTRDQVIQNLFHSKYLLEAYIYDSGAQRLKDIHPVSSHICTQPDVALDLLYDTPAGTYMIIEEGGHPLGVFYLTNTVKQLYFFFMNQQFSMPFQDFLQVFENLEEEIIIARSDGTICYVNPKAEEIMNLPIQEIMKKNPVRHGK